MTLARWQGWAGLAIGGGALVAGLIATRGDEDAADALRRFGKAEARRRDAMASVAIDLPAADPAPRRAALAVEVTATALRLDGVDVTPAALAERARRAADDDPAIEAMISSTTDVPYARVIEVMESLRGAGVEKIALTAAP